jgi:hypothetical protein
MKRAGYFGAISLLLILPAAASAQRMTTEELEARRAAAEAEYKRQQEERRRMEERREQMERGVKAGAKPVAAAVPLRLESQLSGREKRLLAPHPDERLKYEAFLRGPGTGLFRLIALSGPTVSAGAQASSPVIPIRGGGSFYSFSKRRHEADEWAQVRLREGLLQTGVTLQERVVPFGGGETTTIRFIPDGLTAFGALGALPLAEVGVQTPGVGFLDRLAPPTEHAELDGLARRLAAGVRDGEFFYAASLPVKTDVTFALRSVLYKQADVLVAFRVVRRDEDGSLHVLWKQLKSYPAPSLKGKPPKRG